MSYMLESYIKDARESGKTDIQIKEELVKAGWQTKEIDVALFGPVEDDLPKGLPKRMRFLQIILLMFGILFLLLSILQISLPFIVDSQVFYTNELSQIDDISMIMSGLSLAMFSLVLFILFRISRSNEKIVFIYGIGITGVIVVARSLELLADWGHIEPDNAVSWGLTLVAAIIWIRFLFYCRGYLKNETVRPRLRVLVLLTMGMILFASAMRGYVYWQSNQLREQVLENDLERLSFSEMNY